MISDLPELKRFLSRLGIQAKRSLSQNFLIDSASIDKLIDAANISKNDTVLEIGPGPGALTEKLLQHTPNVIAIELDRVFAKELPRLSTDLTVHEADALTFDYTSLPRLKVIASLPYHIATPLILKLCALPNIESITVIIQKEVALRFCAEPSTKAYGALTIQTQFLASSKLLFTLPPNSFYPPPKIDSAAIQLTPHSPPYSFEAEPFFDFVYKAFRQRRKMLKNTCPELAQPMQELGISPTARAESLTLDQFAQLWQSISIE